MAHLSQRPPWDGIRFRRAASASLRIILEEASECLQSLMGPQLQCSRLVPQLETQTFWPIRRKRDVLDAVGRAYRARCACGRELRVASYWYLQEDSFHFEWDQANSAKSCVKHGVDSEEVESLFALRLGVPLGRQIAPGVDEERLCIVGPSINDRMVSVVFTLREGKTGPSVRGQRAAKNGGFMKRYAKRLKEYDRIEFDADEIIAGMSRLKGARRKPTSIALEEELLAELKMVAAKKGVPYQVLMRLLIAEGLKRLKKKVA